MPTARTEEGAADADQEGRSGSQPERPRDGGKRC